MDTLIIAVRHGQTDWNAEGRVQGHLNSSLTASGRAQAVAVARRLADTHDITAIYSSDLGRALETARPTAEALALPVTPEERLRERRLGVFEGLTFVDARARFPDYFTRYRARDPELDLETGESLVTFRARVADAVSDIGSRHRAETVLLVTHGGVLDLLYRIATDMPLEQERNFEVENASLNLLRWDGHRLHLESWGDVSHHASSQGAEEF